MIISITLGRTSLVLVQAKPLRSHALYLVIKGIHLLGAPLIPGFRRIGAAQFFQRFLDREFGCFGHGKPHFQAKRVQPLISLEGRQLAAELTRRPEAVSGNREACFQCFRSGAGVR
jgi:hypothetical protein